MKNNENKSIGRTIIDCIIGLVYTAGVIGMYWKATTSILNHIENKEKEDK